MEESAVKAFVMVVTKVQRTGNLKVTCSHATRIPRDNVGPIRD